MRASHCVQLTLILLRISCYEPRIQIESPIALAGIQIGFRQVVAEMQMCKVTGRPCLSEHSDLLTFLKRNYNVNYNVCPIKDVNFIILSQRL